MDKNRTELPAEFLDAAVELMGRSGRRGEVRVQGHSMLPTLLPGQQLSVEFRSGEVRRGDLVLFRQAEILVVHRLVGVSRFPDGRRALRTRGDGVLACDPRVDPEAIVGRVTAVRDAGGWWDLRRPAARAYGKALACHDRFWAAAGALGFLGDRVLRRIGIAPRLRGWVAGVDRRLLRVAHRLLFERIHARVDPERAFG